MEEEEKKISRLWECDVKTNEGLLSIYVKTTENALNKAKEEAKATAEGIYIKDLLGDKGFSYAYLDKITLIFEEEEKND